MSLLRTHNHRARRRGRLGSPDPYTVEDAVRQLQFVDRYAMGPRKLEDLLHQKSPEEVLAGWREVAPALSKIYKSMEVSRDPG